MNRQTLLAVIHRQLRESLAETGELRPLSEIVGCVSDEIRSARNGAVASGVIPIETVAAFVDGELSDAESDALCQVVTFDNSVLAELVSAVRAISQPLEELPPLPESLTGQLLAMRSSLPVPTQTQMDDAIAEHAIEAPAESRPEPTVIPPTIKAESARTRASRRPRRQRPFATVAAVASIAAAIAVIAFLIVRSNRHAPEQPDFVDHNLTPVIPVPGLTDPNSESEVQIAEDHRDPPSELPSLAPDMPVVPNRSPVAQQNDQPSVRPDREPDKTLAPKQQISDRPPPTTVVKATKLKGARWTDVTGVLSRRNQVNVSSQARATTWEPITADSVVDVLPTGARGTNILQTLPQSRAEASFESGGRIVMSSDTSIQVGKGDESISAAIAVQHGDVALMDLPADTHIRLLSAGKHVASLRWQSKASAVMQYGENGLEVHVRGGTIEINDQPKKDASVAIARDRSVQSIKSPNRIPTWVDRPVETIHVKQTFLAQIRESNNVMTTVNQQIRNISQAPRLNDADAKSLATLARWQSALAGERIFRLANSPIPAVRLAALERVSSLPRWDPRYPRTWAMIETSVRDKQRAQRFKRWCIQIQQRNPLNDAQINALLDDLQASDIGSRAMSDYMLRRFSADQRRLPSFDPTSTGATQLNGVNLWRKFFGRNAIRNQRPAAGANQRPAAGANQLRAAAAANQQRPATNQQRPGVNQQRPAAIDRQR